PEVRQILSRACSQTSFRRCGASRCSSRTGRAPATTSVPNTWRSPIPTDTPSCSTPAPLPRNEPLSQAELRRDCGLCAGLARCQGGLFHVRAELLAGPFAERIRRLCQTQAGSTHHGVTRHRQRAALGRDAVSANGRHEDDARALSGRRACFLPPAPASPPLLLRHPHPP